MYPRILRLIVFSCLCCQLYSQSCADIAAGTITLSDTVVCFGDTLTMVPDGSTVIPLGQNVTGYAVVISTEDISQSTAPFADPSFIALFGISADTFTINFVHDGSPIEAGAYYFTPVALAGGVYTDPQQTFALMDFTDGCILAGESQITVLKMEPSSVDDLSDPALAGAFRLYPNPAIATINLSYSFSSPLDLRLAIFDQLGRNVLNRRITDAFQGSLGIDVSAFPGGRYALQLSDGRRQSIKSFIVR